MSVSALSAPAFGQLYSANFNTGTSAGPEWSSTTIDTTPSGERYLGQFGSGGITLSLGSQPAGAYTLTFDFYAIQSLDGNGPAGGGADNFEFTANNAFSLFSTNFDNFGSSGQAYPNAVGGPSNAPGTGAFATNTLGFAFGGAQFADAIYRLSFVFNHPGGNLFFGFNSQQGQGVGDEGWGLDNVTVVPAPGAACALGALALAGLRRRR
jgi:hypothetical protein